MKVTDYVIEHASRWMCQRNSFSLTQEQGSNKVDNWLCLLVFPKSWKSKIGEVKSVLYLICFVLIDTSARNGEKTSTTHPTGEVLYIQTHNHDRVRWPGNADPYIRRGVFSRCIDAKICPGDNSGPQENPHTSKSTLHTQGNHNQAPLH